MNTAKLIGRDFLVDNFAPPVYLQFTQGNLQDVSTPPVHELLGRGMGQTTHVSTLASKGWIILEVIISPLANQEAMEREVPQPRMEEDGTVGATHSTR